MKTKLCILLILVTGAWATAQTNYYTSDLPEKTTLDGSDTEYLYLQDGVTDKHVTVETLVEVIGDSTAQVREEMNDSVLAVRQDLSSLVASETYWNIKNGSSYLGWGLGYLRSRTLYPYRPGLGDNYVSVRIGSEPSSAYNEYHLTVDGKTLLMDTVRLRKRLEFHTYAAIYDSNQVLWFRQGATLHSLAELAQLPAGLTQHCDVSTSTYDWSFNDASSNGIAWDYSAGQLTIKAPTTLLIESPNTDLGDSAWVDTLGAAVVNVTGGIYMDGSLHTTWGGGGTGNVTYTPPAQYSVWAGDPDSTNAPFWVALEQDTSKSVYIAYTSSDVSATTATLADVTGLALDLAASSVYILEIHLPMDANTTGGIKYSITGTVGVSDINATEILYSGSGIDQVELINGLPETHYTSSESIYSLSFNGTLFTSTAGTIKVQFAQSTASGTSVLNKGAYIKAIKL